MKEPNIHLKGKSFAWGFLLYFALFTPAIWGGKVGLNKNFCIILLALSGYVPFLIQFITGYALDGMWTARYSRTERPEVYWPLLFLSLLLGLFFTVAAYNLYNTSSRAVT